MKLEKDAQAAASAPAALKNIEESNKESNDNSNKKGGPLNINPQLMKTLRSGSKLNRTTKAFENILNSKILSSQSNVKFTSNSIFTNTLRSNPSKIAQMKPSRFDLNNFGLMMMKLLIYLKIILIILLVGLIMIGKKLDLI